MSRTVLITGAVGGIGAATVGCFKAHGWTVIGVDCREPNEAIADSYLVVDLSRTDVAQTIFGAISGITRLDVLVNNAAIQPAAPLLDTTVTEWQQVWEVNVRAAALLTASAAQRMEPDGGAIVNVASVHAIATSPGLAAYVTSKGALVSLTRASALELAPRGIRVNAVLPGAVETRMLVDGLARGNAPEQARRLLASRTPLGRIGRPEEIAEAILFLADSARSSFVTGQTLIVDGGATTRLATE